MRRSTRIRWQIPVQVVSLDSGVAFDETCESVAVNAHGCGLIAHTPLDKGTRVKLGLLPGQEDVTARIVDVVKLGEDGRAWLLGLQLDTPGNVWGVRNPPHDWEKANSVAEGSDQPANAPLAISVAAGAGATSVAAGTPVIATAPASPMNPGAPASSPAVVQSAVAVEAAIAPSLVAVNNSGNSHPRSEQAPPSNGRQSGGAPLYHVRDRDWAELRRQMEEHLQDMMWQLDDQLDAKVERWKEQMVDAEARLDSLCQLQDRLQAHLTVLSEIVKEKIQPESAAGEKAEASPSDTAPAPEPPAASSAETGVATASQVEEIRQLQQWMQSLIHLLPQAVEQHANEAVGCAEERLRTQAAEQLDGLRKQVSELETRLEAAMAAQTAAAGTRDADEHRHKESEAAVLALKEEICQSLVQSVREQFQSLQGELTRAQQTAETENERLRQEWSELRERLERTADEAARTVTEGKTAEQQGQSAAETRLSSRAEELSQALRDQFERAQAELSQARQAMQADNDRLREELQKLSQLQGAAENAMATVAEASASSRQSRETVEAELRKTAEELSHSLQQSLQDQFAKGQSELKNVLQTVQAERVQLDKLAEEALARAARESEQARRDMQESQHKAEDALREIGEQVRNELRATLHTDLDTQRQELLQARGTVEEKSAHLQSQIAELTAQVEEACHAREALQSLVSSMTQAASQQITEGVSAGLQRLASETQAQAEGRQLEFARQVEEARGAAAAAREQMAELAKQAIEISGRVAESERNRAAMQSRLDAAISAAERRLESRANTIQDRALGQAEEQIKRLEDQVNAQQRKLDDLSRQRQQEIQLALDEHMGALRGSSETMLRKLSEELRSSLNSHLKEEFAHQRHLWEKQREASQAEKAWVEARANELAGRWEGRLQGYIERATGDAIGKLRQDVDQAAAEIIHAQMDEVRKQFSLCLEPLLGRAENTSGSLEKLLTRLQKETDRVEAQTGALQRQRDEAEDWMEQQMGRLRQAVHDAVVETSGEIKGRIHMAVEMAREPIEQRSREGQRQLEELAARKSREIAERLSEFEKAIVPRLQAHVTETLEKFQHDTEQVAQKSVHRCQDDLAETLDSMLHLVRGKRESKSK
ncbi:MAG TPA: hypothetical protein VKT29_03515 [Terriglobales bacterium]|nr:hypothetical protein [Terriglobales bacterium]